MFTLIVLVLSSLLCAAMAEPGVGVVAAIPAVPAPVVTAHSSQYFYRNHNRLVAAPLVAPARLVAPAPVLAHAPVLAPAPVLPAARFVAAPSPLLASGRLLAAPPAHYAPHLAFSGAPAYAPAPVVAIK